MSGQGFPGTDAGKASTLAGTMNGILDKFLQGIDDCLPAKVLSYDREKNVAKVRPMVALLTTSGEIIPRPSVASVPVLALGCGRFVVNFPLKEGSLGRIKASDRDISLFMQGLAEAKPNTTRKHSFEDGFFIPDIVRGYSIQGEDADNMVIQTLDGSVRVALWEDRVKMTAGETWLAVNKDGVITGTAPKKVFFDTPLVEFAGIFRSGTGQGGGISEMNGGLKTTLDVVAGGVSAMNHPHDGVEPGSGRSGSPIGGA